MSITESRSHLELLSTGTDPSPVLAISSGFRPHHQDLVEQWGPEDRVDHCPKSEYHWVDLSTGVVGGPVLCRKSTCIFCLRVKAKQIHAAVRLARPSHMALLTALSGDWQSDRKMVNRLRFYLRDRDGLTFAFAWAIEPNPRGTGYHAHGWAWGDPIPRGIFEHRTGQVGFGISHLKRVTYNGSFAYVLKNAVHNAASLDEHIRLNGREPLHARGFWRDPSTGEVLTQPEAFKRSDAKPDDPYRDRDDWVPVPTRSIGADPCCVTEISDSSPLSDLGSSRRPMLTVACRAVGDGF